MTTAHAGQPLVVSVPDPTYLAPLSDIEGVEVVVWNLASPHARAAEVRLAVTPYLGSVSLRDLTPQVPALEVLQLQSAGYDHYVADVPPGVALCNAAGVHDASTAELVLTLSLASLRGIPELVEAQSRSEWLPTSIRPALADKRVVVIGYGHIGRAIVRRFLPFEVEITVVASRARAGDDLVDRVHGIDELPELAAAADVLVVIVPLNEATRGLVDAGLLARLPDRALVVNVARGPVVVTADLLAECASGRLRAALDVTDPEPLPADHPAWTTPGVLVTPHVGGATTAMRPRALALIRRQAEALRDGEPLVNIVNR
ncbi:hydroxyacid dehydrogenase [Humibacillus sp. DSM 29435]|uniref:2-hydroxyacid dehydrogenase n=1 Tax=Humibacillus sp. DSM 29435 TaxID=1869167 RepID=UPI0008731222|nr:2-hydroxyacid dehydrogenase [Humibacillus sp. DSM 29435]OFE16750.1 hydroxyacid dehydrogenase [Humibacillus sp. DSM 29435]